MTVVNAIPTGRGAAIGIDPTTMARVELERSEGPIAVEIRDRHGEPADEDPSLAEACVEVVAGAFDEQLSGRVVTETELPIARGLKSSSVAANAIVLAVLDALDAEADATTVLDLAVEAARRAGVTVTGALDDAAASLMGGLVVTDNRQDRVVRREPLNNEYHVLVLVPLERAYTSEVDDLDDLRPVAERCLAYLEDDAWRTALTLNGLGVAAALRQGLDPAYRALVAGARAAGTTGTGPAVAAVCDEDTTTAIRGAWEPYQAPILTARTTDAGLMEVGA